MIGPSEDDITDPYRMLQALTKSGQPIPIWLPNESYEAAAILLELLNAEKTTPETHPKIEHSADNPD